MIVFTKRLFPLPDSKLSSSEASCALVGSDPKDADAQNNLALLLHEGHGGPRVDGVAEARRLLGLAAAQGHANLRAYSRNDLANMVRNGRGGPKDEAEASRL